MAVSDVVFDFASRRFTLFLGGLLIFGLVVTAPQDGTAQDRGALKLHPTSPATIPWTPDPVHLIECGGDEQISEEILDLAWRIHRARPAIGDGEVRGRSLDTGHGGALSGLRIGVSAGHGIQWNSDLGRWNFQRDVQTFGFGTLREDIHTAQWAIDYLNEMIERAGGEVVWMRDRDYGAEHVVVDNDTGLGYLEDGLWQTGGAEGFGGTYRYAPLDPQGASRARWSFQVAEDGNYPIYVHFLASANRSARAHYEIRHAEGTSDRVLSQAELLIEDYPRADYPNTPPPTTATHRQNELWHYLGTYPFRKHDTYEVSLSNLGEDAEKVVIADAIRVGAGYGDTTGTNGQPSGRLRWEESANTFLEWLGVPAWMKVGDVAIRPLYAIYRGVDAYVSVHTNCCNSSGTSTWLWYPEMWIHENSWPAGFKENSLPPGTYDMGRAVHDAVIARLRDSWSESWRNAGIFGANFGELRPFREGWKADVDGRNPSDPLSIPALLMEIAFHDVEGDGLYLREMGFRHEVARGFLVGLIRHFQGPAAAIPPLPPRALSATATDAGLAIRWQDPLDSLVPQAAPSRYHVYTSSDGVLFSKEPIDVAGTEVVLPMDGCEPLFVTVTAVNEGGESLDSPVVGGRRPLLNGPRILYVDGVRREVKTERDPNNLRSYARIYAPALGDALFGAGVDITTDTDLERALSAGEENGGYELLVWATGQTSVHDGALLPAARQPLQDYLQAGGRLLISGSELGHDLVETGTTEDRAYFENILGAAFVADGAETTLVDASSLGLDAALEFGNCTADSICIDWPDVLGARPGGSVVFPYANGGGAAILSPSGKVIVVGFPLETVASPTERHELIAALAASLLGAVPAIENGLCVEAEPDQPDQPDQPGVDAGHLGDTGPDEPDAIQADIGLHDAPAAQVVTNSGCACRTSPALPPSPLLPILVVFGAFVLRSARPTA
ncbi:MAG: hypothetical protein ACNA8W_08780 [Bradymonadaceae bacterium]